MADEITDSLETPEKIEVDKNRALRRGSLGCNSPKSSQNVGSRYLRASTGSCHDFCKYGIKHSTDEKAREPFRRRYVKEMNGVPGQQKDKVVVSPKPPTDTKSPIPSPDTKSYYSTKSKTSSSLNKANVVKNKPSMGDTKNEYDPSHFPSPDTKSSGKKPTKALDGKTYSQGQNRTLLPKQNPSSAKKLSSPDPPEITMSVFFPSEKTEVPIEQGSLPANKVQRSVRKPIYRSSHHPPPVKLKLVMAKPSLSSEKSDVVHGKGGRNKAATDQNVTALQASVKKVLAPPATSLPHKLSLIKSKRNGNLRLSSPVKNQNRINRVKTNTSSDEKILHATIKTEIEDTIESVPNNHSVPLPPSPSSSKSLSSKNGDGEAQKFISDKAYAATGRQSPVEENHNKTNTTSDEKIPEKTWHATIKTEASVPDDHPVPLLPSPSLSKSLSSKDSDGEAEKIISNNNERAETCSLPPIEENHIKAMRKGRAVVSVSEGKPSIPVKLKFRSRKVVGLQSDNYSPRGAKFRRARVLGAEDSNSYLRRTLKKAGTVDDAAASADGVRISSKKLVSKHQDKYISNNNEYALIGSQSPKEGNHNKTKRKSRAAASVSEGKHYAPVKLKFRSGKVVDLQTDNYSIPRRLKFRKARILSAEESNSYLRRQTLKTGFDDDAAVAADGVGISSDEKGVLKKQEKFISNNNMEDDHNKTMRNKAVFSVSRGGKQSAPVKLMFRSGKTVDLQSDNYSPRRLKFRRPRVIDAEESTSYLRKRTLKKADGLGISSEKVVLKHQDVQDKKDAQGLFNNVIEETASKLVESRKSKVKALVGAFETVISLQESKPSN